MLTRSTGALLAVLGTLGAYPAGAADPEMSFTSVPALGSFNDLAGQVTGADPAAYRVIVYIFVPEGNGWWNKPSFDQVLTFAPDGAWTADVTTGGSDQNATKLAAFLIPATYTPPNLAGAADLPAGLLDAAAAQEAVYRHTLGNTRLVYFSGYEWWVKHRTEPAGPGPNFFSNSHDSVRIDRDGRLHMTIRQSGSTWYCSEIVSTANFGYGSYLFRLASPVDQLDRNTVVGLFTWSDHPDYAHREIDIEFSRWLNPANDEAQFVLQPWDWPGHIDRFSLGAGHLPSVHGFTWRNGGILWRSVRGAAWFNPAPGATIREWDYSAGDVPLPGDENARINFWLINGWAPSNGQPAEVVLDGFQHVALGNEEDTMVSGVITSNIPADQIQDGALLRLTAPAGASAYEWYRAGQPVDQTSRITGVEGQVLVFDTVQVDDEGEYMCAYDVRGEKQWLQTEPFILNVVTIPNVPASSVAGAMLAVAGLLSLALSRVR